MQVQFTWQFEVELACVREENAVTKATNGEKSLVAVFAPKQMLLFRLTELLGGVNLLRAVVDVNHILILNNCVFFSNSVYKIDKTNKLFYYLCKDYVVLI